MKKISLSILFLLWMASILAIFFIVQKPDFLQVLAGLKHLFLVIFIPFSMAALSSCIGSILLKDSDALERLTLGTSLGMGILGLAGFGLAVSGLAKPLVIFIIFFILAGYFLYAGKLNQFWMDVIRAAKEISASAKNAAAWIPASFLIAASLAFLMSLAPPAEDFDALFYHLTVPAWWLRDGSLTLAAVPHYWYPQIVEGSFVFPLVFGVDTSSHLIHFLWALLSILLLWHWVRQLWGDSTSWNLIAILLTMPSLLWLASWAYTDYALTFTSIAVLYSLWKWKDNRSIKWILISGITAGMAISVKYTGFIVPLTGAVLVIIWESNWLRRIKSAFYFSAAAILTASPWYLRNWIWMGNPFYPFAFGGKFWDSFLAQAYSAAGSGIGFDWGQLLLLPLTATLGTRDMNYFDGRIGPFFLIFLPLLIYILFQVRSMKENQKTALLASALFSLLSIAAWVIGVINSAHLFQTRLLFPALFLVTIPLSVGMNELVTLDTPRFKFSYIVYSMLAFVTFVNLLNFGLQTLARSPLAAAIGMVSRQQYLERRQPDYASAILLMEEVPADAKVYFLFEPRSYGMSPRVQPDSINVNFLHDVWLYKTPEKIIASWREQGYTHILISNRGAEFILQSESRADKLLLEAVKQLLAPVGASQSGIYELYKIP